MAADRKCFRMIGGVLIERTVGEVLPALEETQVGVFPYAKPFLFRVERNSRTINGAV